MTSTSSDATIQGLWWQWALRIGLAMVIGGASMIVAFVLLLGLVFGTPGWYSSGFVYPVVIMAVLVPGAAAGWLQRGLLPKGVNRAGWIIVSTAGVLACMLSLDAASGLRRITWRPRSLEQDLAWLLPLAASGLFGAMQWWLARRYRLAPSLTALHAASWVSLFQVAGIAPPSVIGPVVLVWCVLYALCSGLAMQWILSGPRQRRRRPQGIDAQGHV